MKTTFNNRGSNVHATKGFSLLELSMVLIIIGVLLTGIVSLAEYLKQKALAGQTVQQLIAICTAARSAYDEFQPQGTNTFAANGGGNGGPIDIGVFSVGGAHNTGLRMGMDNIGNMYSISQAGIIDNSVSTLASTMDIHVTTTKVSELGIRQIGSRILAANPSPERGVNTLWNGPLAQTDANNFDVICNLN